MIQRAIICCAPTVLLCSFTGAAQVRPVKRPLGAKTVASKPAAGTAQIPVTKLTAADILILLQDDIKNNPRAANFADDAEARKNVLTNLRQALALASEAKKTGFADSDSMKVQLDLSKDQMLASIYNDKLNTDQGKPVNPAAPLDQIADADAEKFLNAPANKAVYDAKLKKFLVFLADLAKTAEIPDDPNGAGTKFAVTQWKKVVYGAARAKQSGLVTKAVDLQARMQQSLVLSREYSRQKLSALIEPTPAEVDAFVKVNPQYSKAPYLARAEEILKKANAGEDFAGLANKYTEDPGNKDQATGQTNGGLYDWSDRARYVGPFSDGAWALNENQISGIVETEYGFHILKLEGKRTVKNVDGKDEQQVKVRHILVLTNYNDGSNPPMPLAEAAKKAIETKKQETVLADIIARNPVDLPADFAFTAVAEKPVAAAKPPAKTTRPAARVTKKTH